MTLTVSLLLERTWRIRKRLLSRSMPLPLSSAVHGAEAALAPVHEVVALVVRVRGARHDQLRAGHRLELVLALRCRFRSSVATWSCASTAGEEAFAEDTAAEGNAAGICRRLPFTTRKMSRDSIAVKLMR